MGLRRVVATVYGNTLLRVMLVRGRAYTWENFLLTGAFGGVFAASAVRSAAWLQNRMAIAHLPDGAMPPDRLDEFSDPGHWEFLAQTGQLLLITLLVVVLVFKAAILPWLTRYNFKVLLNENYRMLPLTEEQLIFALMDWKVAKVFAVTLACFALYFGSPRLAHEPDSLVMFRISLIFVTAAAAWFYRLGQSRLFVREFVKTRLFWAGLFWFFILIVPIFFMYRMNLMQFNTLENFREMMALYVFTTTYIFVSAIPVPERVAEKMIEMARAPEEPQEKPGA